MADSALAVFQQAENELRAGSYPAALASYLRVVRGVPQFLRARFRVADTLLNLKARAEALEVYKAFAWHALKVGQPLAGLAAIKMAALLDPRELEAIEVLAELYSRDSDRIGEAVEEEALKRQLVASDQAAPTVTLPPAELVATAAREAADTSTAAQYPDKLPGVPLFSFLEEDAFVGVLASLQLRRFARGSVVIAEGQPGDSFFILAEGTVEVTRKVGPKTINLARLRPGAVFGEMALISRAPRTATVTASDDCELLELKRALVEAEAQKLASVTQALKEFTHERFLQNLTATSPVFRPFPRGMRTEIIRKFRDFPVDPGDELIAEGEEGQGLFLVLKGNVEVSKKGPDGKVVLATLKEGDIFGEISLIQETPTTATCTAITRGELLFLPKKDFASTVARHPELRAELSKITSERLQKNKELMDTAPLEIIEDDDLIML